MLRQLILALALTFVTVIIHVVGTVRGVVPAARGRESKAPVSERLGVVLTLSRLVSGLLILHLVEMAIWAAAYTAFGVFPNFETSLYFSLKSYTTVGYGDVLPPTDSRLLGPMEAAVGVLMLGLSTSIIVTEVQRLNGRRPE